MNSQRPGTEGSPEGGRDFVILPLGGAGEIGMNLYLYGWGSGDRREWVMVDCGVMFGDEKTPGVELILPDISFIEERRRDLLGILVTHAHEDHIGAIPWVAHRLDAPVYATRFAAILIRQKLEEFGWEDDVEIIEVTPGSRIRLGEIEVEYVPVTHSLPEPNSLVLRTPAGTVVHTGDFKIDREPVIPPEFSFERLRQIGDEGVEALVCDSTNAAREGRSPSEAEVARSLEEIIASAPGRVAVTTFSSHVGRIKTVAEAAMRHGREVVVAGYAMKRVIEAAREVGLLDGGLRFLEEDAFGFLPPEKVVLLCTGSQGEPRAALSRIADDVHPRIALEKGDIVVFSAFTIPGNEKAVISVMNRLALLGVEVIANTPERLVHTSGHPRREELAEYYRLVRPKRLIPMHGEPYHMMMHAEFARRQGIPEVAQMVDGQMLRLCPGPAEIVGEAVSGQLHVDGRLLVPGEKGPVRQRRRLSFVGIVVLAVALDGRGNIRGPVQIITEGVPERTADGDLMEDVLLDAADDALENMGRARRRNDETVIETLRIAVRRTAVEEWGKKPVVHVLVQRV
jgi:ribonuclease J